MSITLLASCSLKQSGFQLKLWNKKKENIYLGHSSDQKLWLENILSPIVKKKNLDNYLQKF